MKSSLIQKYTDFAFRMHQVVSRSGKKMIEPTQYCYVRKLHILHHSPKYQSQMKYISVHLQRKSHFLKSSTFLNFRCPKRNVQILLLVSDHKRGNNVWGFPLVCSHKSVTCTQEISFPEVHRTQIRMRCPVFPFVCASQMLPSISHVVSDNLWFIITFSSF